MDEKDEEGGGSRWKGFSDYENVAAQLHEDINNAVRAYSHLNSKDQQNIGLTPQTAVQTRQAILHIAKRLKYEIEKNGHVDAFEGMEDDWTGDDGYVARLERTDFYSDGVPPWLEDMVDDIVKAGWELGYTKAGIERPANPDEDDEQVKEMID